MPHYLPGTKQCYLLNYLCNSLMYIKCEVEMPHYLLGTTAGGIWSGRAVSKPPPSKSQRSSENKLNPS